MQFNYFESYSLQQKNIMGVFSSGFKQKIYDRILYNLPLMFSSSGIFEKDVQGQTLEAEGQLGQSSFDFVQTLDEFDLEQSCLLRLKIQREKIEQLTKLYQENDKELQRRSAKEKIMQEEIDKLLEISSLQGQWEELKNKHEALSKKNEFTEAELIEIKREFQSFTVSKGIQVDQLKDDIKYHKEQKLLSDANWEAIILEKQEQILKQARKSQQSEYELCEHIKKLEQKIQTLSEQLASKQEEQGTKKVEFKSQIQAREQDLVSFQKALQSMKRLNTELKSKMVDMEDKFAKEKEELLSVLDQLRSQIKIYRKDQSEKENQLYQYKQMIKKCDTKNQTLEQTVESLKSNMKKFKVNTDSNIKKMTSSTDQEKGKMELFIHELKTELEKSQQEKNSLFSEVKKLKGLIDRKQQQEKQRKLLLMSEFREIDKMEKMVKKIL